MPRKLDKEVEELFEAAGQPLPELEAEPAPAVSISEPAIDIVPEANTVFNAEVAAEWLSKAHLRLRGTIRSLRFELVGNEPHFEFLFGLAIQAVAKKYRTRHAEFPGVLFVPEHLAEHSALAEMERGEQIGKFVSFIHK